MFSFSRNVWRCIYLGIAFKPMQHSTGAFLNLVFVVRILRGGLFWLSGSSLCEFSHLFGGLEVELMAENYLSEQSKWCALNFQTQPFSPRKPSSNSRKGCLKSFFMLFLCSSLLSTCQKDESRYRNVRSLFSFLFSSVWSEKGVMENDANKNDWRKANRT